MRHSKWDTSYI